MKRMAELHNIAQVSTVAFRKNAEKVFQEHAKSLNDLHRLRGQFGRKIY